LVDDFELEGTEALSNTKILRWERNVEQNSHESRNFQVKTISREGSPHFVRLYWVKFLRMYIRINKDIRYASVINLFSLVSTL
jgi:hypothetical protein